jgi:hypothetical protein
MGVQGRAGIAELKPEKKPTARVRYDKARVERPERWI